MRGEPGLSTSAVVDHVCVGNLAGASAGVGGNGCRKRRSFGHLCLGYSKASLCASPPGCSVDMSSTSAE